METLLASIDPSRDHSISGLVAWHGRLMVLAWGIFIPTGILLARFYKVTSRQNWPEELDNKFWWHGHRLSQYSALVLMLIALGLILLAKGRSYSSGNAATLHWLFGWMTMVLGFLQAVSGWMRGTKGGPTELDKNGSLEGDHYSMTHRRITFEYAHKFLGYIAFLIACITTLLGLWIANAPVWMFIGLAFLWAIIISAVIYLQKTKGSLDTYQAIWGPETKHPGNKRKPIGFGIGRR